eukprot:TRINITY_DN16532_c0_g1_i1.p1 TRINITY_DN16532_c0_g1~~TRINITY_DN16532_c0_g1_i1.p1  ORF type:complete len:479 (-),score=73.02 TRINITY_DN16532_c0_g1_i1:71-1507(-)
MKKMDMDKLNYMSKDEWRVLTAIEMGLKNHLFVPISLIESIANLKRSNTYKVVQLLLKNRLIKHQGKAYDGYTLSYLGYDFLAVRTLLKRRSIKELCGQMGVGKESDVYFAVDHEDAPLVIKFTRLGRPSFRAILSKRDYIKDRTAWNWLYLSRLSALKEFAYLRALHSHGIPTPVPLDQNRHAIVMSYIDAKPLNQVRELSNPRALYQNLMDTILKFGEMGIIHCDFNEFNILVDHMSNFWVIDFPQIVSVTHPNAEMLFDRDITCIQTFFSKRYSVEFLSKPNLREDVKVSFDIMKETTISKFLKDQLAGKTEDLALIDNLHEVIDPEPEEEMKVGEEAMKIQDEWIFEDEEEMPEEPAPSTAPKEAIELPTEIPAPPSESPEKQTEEEKIPLKKEGKMDAETIKSKVKKQYKSQFYKAKQRRNRNKSKRKKQGKGEKIFEEEITTIQIPSLLLICLLYTSPSPRDLSTSRMPSSA